MMRQSGVVAFCVLLAVAVWPAAAFARSVPVEQKGCRILALAYDRSFSRGSQTVFADNAIRRFKRSSDPQVTAIVEGDPATLGADLGTWCKATYPKDLSVQRAKYPTPIATTAPTPPPTAAPTVPPTAAPAVVPPPPAAPTAYFDNCTEAKAAGAAPLYSGEPGYRSALDRDGDGVACET